MKILDHPAQYEFFFFLHYLTFFIISIGGGGDGGLGWVRWGLWSFFDNNVSSILLFIIQEQATTQQKPKGNQSTCTVGNARLWNMESGKNSLRNPKSWALESEIKLKE